MSQLSALIQKFQRVARNLPHPEWAPLLTLLTAAGLMWAFIGLADEVTEGSTKATDRKILLLLRNPADSADPLGPQIIEEIGRDFTALGGVGVLTLVAVATVCFLMLVPMVRTACYVAVASGGAIGLSLAMKAFFSRERPDLVPHGSQVYTSSFPSGHSMMAAAVYLTIGMLLARVVKTRRLQVFCIVLAVILTCAVGVSRVYLGVHWPSDVLAGWTVGAAWALVCWLLAGWLQAAGQIEQEVDVQDVDVQESPGPPA